MIQDRIVLITGATGAVGQVVARVMAQSGARLALAARRQAALDELATQLALPSDRVLAHAADLADADQVRALCEAVAERWGGVDALLHLAGGWSGGVRLADLTEADWDAALDMNLRSAFLVSRAILPHMASQGWGRIVLIASRAAESPAARQAAYNVAKAGLIALVGSIAAEYRRQGIAANAILPGIIDTPTNRTQMPDSDASRWVKPEELAQLALFLCSEEAGSLNGASIPVYGRV